MTGRHASNTGFTHYLLIVVTGLFFCSGSAFAVCQPEENGNLDVTECQALWQLYNDTQGEQWHKRYYSAQPFTAWDNGPDCRYLNSVIGCKDFNGTKHIIWIALDRMGLKGQVSEAAFANFPYLERIKLSGNEITGAIPRSLAALPMLTDLDLSFNQLTGVIPEALLAEVEDDGKASLDLSDNNLSGVLPDSVGTHAAVHARTEVRLNVMNNPTLSGPIPRAYIQELWGFQFSGTQICEPQDLDMQTWVDHAALSQRTHIACETQPDKHTVSAKIANGQGTLTPMSLEVADGETASFTVEAADNYRTSEVVSGACPEGSWQGTTYTTGAIHQDCDVQFIFNIIELPQFQLDVDVIQVIRNPIFMVPGKPIHVRSYITCPSCTDKISVDVKLSLKLDGQVLRADKRTLMLDQNLSVQDMRENSIFGRSHNVDNYSFDYVTRV